VRRTTPIWLWPNLLSLDAPLIALLWQYLFSRCFHSPLGFIPATLLVCAVWLIYVADRVLDARRDAGEAPRHAFCWTHRKPLLTLWCAVLFGSGLLAFTKLPETILVAGIGLGAVVAAYFLAVHSARGLRYRYLWSKEAVVGIIFGLGTTIVAWEQVRTLADWGTIALFSGLCWLNCVAIEQWESDEHSSSETPWPISWGALSLALLGAALFWGHRPILGGAEVASALSLLMLDRSRNRFSPAALRVLADVALLSPILFLPLAGSA
jgi:hypothetical protein